MQIRTPLCSITTFRAGVRVVLLTGQPVAFTDEEIRELDGRAPPILAPLTTKPAATAAPAPVPTAAGPAGNGDDAGAGDGEGDGDDGDDAGADDGEGDGDADAAPPAPPAKAGKPAGKPAKPGKPTGKPAAAGDTHGL